MPDESTPLAEGGDPPAPAPAPSGGMFGALSDMTTPFAENIHHAHAGVVYHTSFLEDHASTDVEKMEENKSWEGAEIKWTPLFCKGMLASILTAISAYVTYDGYVTGEVDTSNMFLFKCLATGLSVFLTLPNLYQTTLITLTFIALAYDGIFEELQQRRHPIKVLLTAVVLIVVLPLTLPFLILVASVLQPLLTRMGVKQIYGLEVDDMWLIIVGFIDFMQTLVLIPLGFIVVFSSAGPEDVLVNVVAVQIFASLDDDFVTAFAKPMQNKYDALETYCQKKKEDGPDPEELAAIEEWRGTVHARAIPVAAKGLLASIFVLLAAYVGYASIPDFEANYGLIFPFKCGMSALIVMVMVPQLYGTTNTALTFISVARGGVYVELINERGFCATMAISFALFVMLPFALPLLIVFGPCLGPVLNYFGVNDYGLVVVGLIDVLQTIILFPLAVIIFFAADCAIDIYIYFVVVLVFATLDDEFVGAFSDPNAQKIEALETYCEKVAPAGKASSVADDPHPSHPTRPGVGPKTRFVMREDGGFHEHGSQ